MDSTSIMNVYSERYSPWVFPAHKNTITKIHQLQRYKKIIILYNFSLEQNDNIHMLSLISNILIIA